MGCALAFGLLVSAAADAQTPATQNPLPPTTAERTTSQQPKNQASATVPQTAVDVIEPAAVVPPAPLVIRREESLISIPMTSAAATSPRVEGVVSTPLPNLPKMEGIVSTPLPKMEGIVSTPLPKMEGVVVTLPKMEGIVSAPVAIPKLGQPKYEARMATSSSTQVKVGSMFGYRRDPFTRRSKFHSGVDIKARWGDPVGASQPGRVQFAGWHNGYGNLVIVDHGGGVSTYYAHLSSFELGVGAPVARGTIVGYAGSTGRATSPHLHYEVRIDGNAINPFQQVALDPSSAYFNQSRNATDVSGPIPASPAKPNDQ